MSNSCLLGLLERMAGGLPKRILRETEKLLSEPVPGIDARPDEQNARCVCRLIT